MNLTEYLSSGAKSAADLARELSVPPALIYQWRKGLRSVPPERCHAIVMATDGAVSLRDLRPEDCAEIWPELATEKAA